MDKTTLQQTLSRLEPVPEPDPELEQYQTPPRIAADAVNLVNLHEDLKGGTVLDLGTGNGVLAIAAALCDASVTGVDTDPACITVARGNAARLQPDHDLDLEFAVVDVEAVERSADVVVMNPPFGIQNRDANKIFLETAFSVAPSVYSFLHVSREKTEQTAGFYDAFAAEHGYNAQRLELYDFPLPRTQAFHDKEKKHVPVAFYRFTHP